MNVVFVLLLTVGLVQAFVGLTARTSVTRLSSSALSRGSRGGVASRGPALQMGFFDDIMKMFNGGDDESSAAPTSSVSTPPAAVAWVNPEPGRFPPMITVPPAPKRKLVLKDLKPEQLKGKR